MENLQKAKSLNELLEMIAELRENSGDAYDRADFSSLPIFGEYTGNTDEIYSWDNDNFLMQNCNGDWYLEERK